MLGKLVVAAIGRPWSTLALTLVFALVGYGLLLGVPIEAFPDVTNTQVQVISLCPGRAAEEVEREVTIPLERELAGTPEMVDLRSVSVFGLSQITCTFDDGADDFAARVRVLERLRQAEVPGDVIPRLGPESTPVGEVYRFTVDGVGTTAMDRRDLLDRVVVRALRQVQGVADVVAFGGFQQQYHVEVDPERLAVRGLGVPDVVQALARSSGAAGGNYLRHGEEEFVVRGLGYLRDPREIRGVALRAEHGVPITVGDVGRVLLGHVPRRGVVGRGADDEAPEGIVLLLRRAHPALVLAGVHAAVEGLNRDVLPLSVRVTPYYDRSELIHRTLHTVQENLLHGAALVVVLIALFLGAARGAVVVAVVIPLSLLTAFVGLRLLRMPANLISLGAIDFGILVDGAVILVETVYHVIAEHPAMERRDAVALAAAQVVRPIVFSLAIIGTALLPIVTMERTEGRIFAPMAITYAFALLGALVWSLTAIPALARILVRPLGGHGEPRWTIRLRDRYAQGLHACLRRPGRVVALLVFGVAATITAGLRLGSEFLPELNEGGIFVTAVFPASQSLEEGQRLVPLLRRTIGAFPEVREVVSQLGRPEDGTDPSPVNVAQMLVSLHPEEAWRTGRDRRSLVEAMRARPVGSARCC